MGACSYHVLIFTYTSKNAIMFIVILIIMIVSYRSKTQMYICLFQSSTSEIEMLIIRHFICISYIYSHIPFSKLHSKILIISLLNIEAGYSNSLFMICFNSFLLILLLLLLLLLLQCIIIIFIIKRVRQCKAEKEWYTPYQYEDPSATIPTFRQEEKKAKNSRRL